MKHDGESLMFSMVLQTAVNDYKLACSGQESKEYNIEECEEFFNSEYCDDILTLLGISRTAFMNRMRKIKEKYTKKQKNY